MSRRKPDKPQFFYCPKCGNKKLHATYVNDPSIPRYSCRRVWVCDHDEFTDGMRVDCGCKIEVPNRDAEIEDYHNVLDRMASSTPAVVSWLLGRDNKIHRTGIKTLFEGKNLDIVRYRNDTGIGIYMIPHFVRFEETELQETFRSAAAEYVTYGRHTIRKIFWQSRVMLFHKTKESRYYDGPLFSDKTESPELIKMLTDWAAGLDEQFVELQAKIAGARRVYVQNERELVAQIEELAGGVFSVDSYDHVADRVHIKPTGPLTRAQALAMAEALAQLRKSASPAV